VVKALGDYLADRKNDIIFNIKNAIVNYIY